MKNELLEKFRTLLQTDEIASIKLEVRNLGSQYNSETAKEKQLQFEEWKKKDHTEDEEVAFEYVANPIDIEVDELFKEYKERVKEHGKKIAEEQKQCLKEKEAILAKFEELIKDEENISKAFNSFNELTEEWTKIGNVPGDKFQEIQDEFRRLRDTFFYNINIYKQLRENDLQVNEKAKIELIEKIKKLKEVDSIKECDQGLRQYRNEWDNIGPATRENYQALGDEFFGIFREILDKIQAHYDGQREEQHANLEKKLKLVEELKEVLNLEISNHSTWVKKTEVVLGFQAEWKKIGFGPKKENEAAWQDFRGLCDLFFEKKHKFYGSRKEEQEVNKNKKKALIEEAKQWEDSSEWKKASDALIGLQKKWKEVGSTFQRDEQALWTAFRHSCDKFFNKKKKFFSNQDQIQADNLKLKNALIEEINGYEIKGNRNEDLESLRVFSNKWKEIGFVPKKNLKGLFDAYNKALDGKYSSLKLKDNERSVLRYKQRVEQLEGSPSSGNDIRKEKRLLRDKIDRLKARVIQYENNMNFFSGAGAEKMKKDVQRKVDSANREIQEIISKLKLFSND